MRCAFLAFVLTGLFLVVGVAAQRTLDVVRPEEKQKQEQSVAKEQEKRAQRTSTIEFEGASAFSEKELRSAVKEQMATIDQYGLTPPRADDLAFFLEVFYRKHGYEKVNVRYQIAEADRLRLVIDEGPLLSLGQVMFEGNAAEPTQKLFDFVVGPTRERYSKLQTTLPFVAADVEEGADLVHRLYVAEGFLDSVVDKPRYVYRDETNQVDAIIAIHEGRQYSFGEVSFSGQAVYDPETLRGQIVDLLGQPYTEVRVADIPRRLQSYYKTRGYYDVKVEATGTPEEAAEGRVPVEVAITAGPLYRFGSDVNVSGLERLHPGFVTKRFTKLAGQTYSPEVLDEKFRSLMRTGLFNLLQIKPVPEDGNLLRLHISAEEAKSKEFGFSIGYGTFEGAIVGVQYRDRNLFGYGRPVTTSVEVSQRGYKGEILFEDPFFLDTDFTFKNDLAALTFDFEGYSKFEVGDRVELGRKFTKQYEAAVIFAARHVEVTSASINNRFLGQTSYLINTLGFSQTLDLRSSPFVAPRGFVGNTTFDLATKAFGSEIQLARSTIRLAYFLPLGPKPLTPGVVEDQSTPPLHRWFQQSLLAFGARGGLVHSLNNSGPDEQTTIPIDERFFNGGATTVRSFSERDLGPHDPKGNPIGGEFFTVFNVEYTFPILGELQGALFYDAGNLLPTSEKPGLDEMRYALGTGLRYKLPIGPIRLDYGWNPDRQTGEDAGAFHFSFGFAF
ncbi:MAG: outer membrane protein assembly factor [Chthoniobacterales bacterium]